MNTTEEWRSVPSVEYLEASSWGRIRSISYEVPLPNGGVRVTQMSPTFGVTQKMSNNYSRRQVTFRRKTRKVATLVAEAFHGLNPGGLDVSHLDEDSFNNRPDNLAYETRKVNLNKPAIKRWHESRTGENSAIAIGRKARAT